MVHCTEIVISRGNYHLGGRKNNCNNEGVGLRTHTYINFFQLGAFGFFCRQYIKMTHHHGLSAKTLKRALKHAGLRTTGRKAALTKRAKQAHLLKGGAQTLSPAVVGGRRRKTRRHHKFPWM
jgi:hypothetical protein